MMTECYGSDCFKSVIKTLVLSNFSRPYYVTGHLNCIVQPAAVKEKEHATYVVYFFSPGKVQYGKSSI